MVFCVDESLEMVSTKIKDNFGILRGTKLRMASWGLGIASGTLGEVPRIRDGDAAMNVLTKEWTPTHVKATPALPSRGAGASGANALSKNMTTKKKQARTTKTKQVKTKKSSRSRLRKRSWQKIHPSCLHANARRS